MCETCVKVLMKKYLLERVINIFVLQFFYNSSTIHVLQFLIKRYKKTKHCREVV